MPESTSSRPYHRWLRRRVAARWIFLLSILGFVLSAAWGANTLITSTPTSEPWFGSAILSWLLTVASGMYLHGAKCPHCGNQFAVREVGHIYNSFTLKCMTCGLDAREV